MNFEFDLMHTVYITARACGLVAFKYDRTHRTATVSLVPRIYTAFLIPFVSIVLFACKWVEFQSVLERDAGHSTTIMVNMAQIATSYCRTIGIYILQLCYHWAFVRVINNAFRVRQLLDELCHEDDDEARTFLDRKCRSFMRAKCATVFFQIVICGLTTYLYPVFSGLTGLGNNLIYVVSTFFTDGITIVMSSIYCTGMLVALQFYRNLNGKLRRVMRRIRTVSWNESLDAKMKMPFYGEASDALDRLAAMYDVVTKFTLDFNGLLSMSILLTLLNSFMFSLCGVGFFLRFFGVCVFNAFFRT